MIKKISSDIVFNAYESRSLTANCNRRKELGIFLKFSKILVTTFSVVPLHERALSKIATYTVPML